MTEFYAQPYAIDHTGFYFDSTETFENGMACLNRRGCEEVEIQFIDGETYLFRLARAAEIHQGNVALWFEQLDDLDEMASEQVSFLLGLGYSLNDALGRFEEVCLYEGEAPDYARELFEEIYDIPDYLQFYIDYEAIARDMGYNGEIDEIRPGLLITNAHEF